MRKLMLLVLAMLLAGTAGADILPLEDATFGKIRVKSAVIRPVTKRPGVHEVVFTFVDGQSGTCVLDGSVEVVVEQDDSISGTWAANYPKKGCLIAVRTKAALDAWEHALERYKPRDVLPEYVAK